MKLKFLCEDDKKSFLMGIGKTSEISNVGPDWEPTQEMIEEFIKKRKSDRELVYRLKDFRKSQNTKRQWKHDRYKIMKGIKRFHKSIEGKKFHRVLGRFIATRENMQPTEITEIIDLLKAVSSAKTHLFIEMDYYRSIDEWVDYLILLDEALPLFNEMEKSILIYNMDIDKDSFEFLCRLVGLDCIKASFEHEGFYEVGSICEGVLARMGESGVISDEDPYFYTKLVETLNSMRKGDT